MTICRRRVYMDIGLALGSDLSSKCASCIVQTGCAMEQSCIFPVPAVESESQFLHLRMVADDIWQQRRLICVVPKDTGSKNYRQQALDDN